MNSLFCYQTFQVASQPSKALQGEFVPVQGDLIIDLTENKAAANVEIEAPAPPPGDTT